MYSAPGTVWRANTGAGWMDIKEPDAQGGRFNVAYRPYEGKPTVKVGKANSFDEAVELAEEAWQRQKAPETE